MQQDRWKRFITTGHVGDYLEYKKEVRQRTEGNIAEDKTGEVREVGYAGFCNCDRNHN